MADRKTIHHLLTLCGNVDQKTATLLLHRQSSVNEIIELPVADHLSNGMPYVIFKYVRSGTCWINF